MSRLLAFASAIALIPVLAIASLILVGSSTTAGNFRLALREALHAGLRITVGRAAQGVVDVRDRLQKGLTAATDSATNAAWELDRAALDASITAAVITKFVNDEAVSCRQIDVQTDHGVVTLRGMVESRDAADRAILLAGGVDGVVSVQPRLHVREAIRENPVNEVSDGGQE